MRPQFSALGVDDLELLFDAEGKAVHEGDDTSLMQNGTQRWPNGWKI